MPRRKKILRKQIRAFYDDIVEKNLRDGSLIKKYRAASQEKSLPFVLWQLYFPTVFEGGGFDIVIGNPPYVDSETMTKKMPELRELYAKKFKSAKGNWDLYVLFWEKGFEMLNSSGTIALITSNKWLSIKYGEALRKILFPHVFNISDYSAFYVFESAEVSTVVAMAKKKSIESLEVVKFDKDYNEIERYLVDKKLLADLDNLGICLSKNFSTLKKLIANDKLEQHFNISGAATVSETYEIAKLISENGSQKVNPEQFFKFINTGTIDKFTSLWGIKDMTYVKNKYLFPVVKKEELKKNFIRRFNQASLPKLITTGIRYFEVYGDFKGEYLAAKSTEIITAKDDYGIKVLLPILNSSVVFFFLNEAYGGMALSGGITFSPANLSNIPLPPTSFEDKKFLEKFTESHSDNFTQQDQDDLDKYIYGLYRLNEYDIQQIEKFKVENRKKA